VPEENILYFGIHAHAVPVISYRPFEGRNDVTKKPEHVQKAVHRYEAFVLEKLLAASKQALSCLRPARYAYGYGESRINVNRVCRYTRYENGSPAGFSIAQGWSNLGREADHTAFLGTFSDTEGKPIAFLVNYAMHNVAMFLNDAGQGHSAVSSDIGGNVSKRMEKTYPGSVCLWSSGAAGDINCLITGTPEYPDPVTGERREYIRNGLEEAAQRMNMQADIHFQDIRRIQEAMDGGTGAVRLRGAIAYSETPYSEDAVTRRDYTCDPARKYRIRLHLLEIGDTALIGADGELYSELGQVIREASPAAHTVVINHECSLLPDNPAYVFSDEVLELSEEAGECRLPGWNQFRGIPGAIAPSLAETTKNLFTQQQE